MILKITTYFITYRSPAKGGVSNLVHLEKKHLPGEILRGAFFTSALLLIEIFLVLKRGGRHIDSR